MAMLDLEEDHSELDEGLGLPHTLLPAFPHPKAIKGSLPEILPGAMKGGKILFLPWVEFALENPDEIWEAEGSLDPVYFHYHCGFGEKGKVPVFVVETTLIDEELGVKNFSLVTSQVELEDLRSGRLVYSLDVEWKREQIVRDLNEQALHKYDEDSLPDARRLIDDAIRMNGSPSAYLFNNRGLICWKMGETEQAKIDFRESIRLGDHKGDPYFNMGLIYFDEADYQQAQYYLVRALQINPIDSQFLTELGHLYLEMGREEEALDLFGRAFKNDPENAQVDFHLGYYFLYKKREPRRAARYYRKGLKKEPDDQFALADQAVAHWLVGNRHKALAISRILQQHSRLMPYTLNRLVYLNMEMGQYEVALEYYRRAMDLNEQFEPEWLHYNAALVFAKTGRTREALVILDLAVKTGGEAVAQRAMSDAALTGLKSSRDFKKVIRAAARRRNG
ncbi:MAG: tetratricopeptide repeat protein [Thermodesulfobacteriota bacterium]